MVWIGDSPCYTIDVDNTITCVTTPHKADQKAEQVRITAQGGMISNGRVNGELAVTRALGNSGPRPLISTDPEHASISSNNFSSITKLLLTTDGISGTNS